MKYISRELEKTFLEASESFKAVMVTGARQVGKSTMLKHLAKGQNRKIVTMDKESDRELAKSDPELFFQTYKPPILIDEVQKAPELFETIKIMCDESEQAGLFWLTGSQSKKLMKEAKESLAGRIAILKMYSLSQREKLGIIDCGEVDFSFESLNIRQRQFPKNDIHEVFEHIWRGGMPDALNKNEKMLSVYFDSYVDTYLMRDAVDDNGVKDTTGFYKLLKGCAAFSGEMINYASLASSADISQTTAKEWVGILQRMGIIYLLEPFSSNELRRLIKTPKLYFCDTGLCAFLSKWTSKEALMNGAASGRYYENYVVMELIKSYASNSVRANVTYYRDRDKNEIDLIVEESGKLHPLEIKKSANPDRRSMKTFRLIQNAGEEIGAGGIVCMCDSPLPIDKTNSFVPSNLI